MKHLRTKLYLSIGSLFLLVAFLNYLLPEIFVKKEIAQASIHLKKELDEIQNRLKDISSFLIKYTMVDAASELDGVAKWIAEENASHPFNWEFAAQIASYQPKTTLIQLTDLNGNIQAIDLDDERFYTPAWAASEQLVQVKEKVYKAVPHLPTDSQGFQSFLLFEAPKAPLPSFTPLKPLSSVLSIQEKSTELYKTVQMDVTHWLEKIEMIQMVIPLLNDVKRPLGALKMDGKYGLCMLTDEVFSDRPIFSNASQNPNLFVKQPENDLNIGKTVKIDQGTIGLGFSISAIIKKFAEITQKPVIASKEGSFSLGYLPDGKSFDPKTFSQNYVPFQIDLDLMNLTILTPVDEATAFSRFLSTLGAQMVEKTGVILVSAALITLVLALLVLGRISKKITEPIDILTKASVQLGEGKYDQLTFPKLGKRQDEVAVLTHSFENMAIALEDRDKIHGVLNKVVSKEISDEILKKKIELKGEERTITLFFSDIRGFTRMSEKYNPQQLIQMLNEYMTRMCRIVDDTHGVVDKFVGDEIMALYGAPVILASHAAKAIDAALRMKTDLLAWNEQRGKENKPPFEVGFGIHTGPVYIGNMGAENRLNYTAIGSNVNLASRLCSKALPMQILISDDTLNQPDVKGRFRVRPLEPLSLKGIDHPVQAYEVLGLPS